MNPKHKLNLSKEEMKKFTDKIYKETKEKLLKEVYSEKEAEELIKNLI